MQHTLDDSFFVVIEGLDGSGKTEISRRLKRALRQTYQQDVDLTFEPHDPSTAGLFIRRVLTKKVRHVQPRTLALAFALNRADHNDRIINPFLNNKPGRIMLCDRYYLSSLVYQTTPAISMEAVMTLNEGVRKPDLTIFLNASARTCYERMRKRPEDKELFEKNLTETRNKYATAIEFLRKAGDTIVEVNADSDIETVLNDILDRLVEHGPDGILIQRSLIEETLDVFSLSGQDDPALKIEEIVRRFAERWESGPLANPAQFRDALLNWREAIDREVEWLSYDDLGLLLIGYLQRWHYHVRDRLSWTETCAYQVEYDLPIGIKQYGTLLLLTEAQQYDTITRQLHLMLDQVQDADTMKRLSDFMFVLDTAPARATAAYYEQAANGSRVSPAVRIIGRKEIAQFVFVDVLANFFHEHQPTMQANIQYQTVIQDILEQEQLQPYWDNAIANLP